MFQKKNLSLGHVLEIILKFRKFQAQYSCKVYFYVKREISERPALAPKVAVFLGDSKRFKATLGKFPQNVM